MGQSHVMKVNSMLFIRYHTCLPFQFRAIEAVGYKVHPTLLYPHLSGVALMTICYHTQRCPTIMAINIAKLGGLLSWNWTKLTERYWPRWSMIAEPVSKRWSIGSGFRPRCVGALEEQGAITFDHRSESIPANRFSNIIGRRSLRIASCLHDPDWRHSDPSHPC